MCTHTCRGGTLQKTMTANFKGLNSCGSWVSGSWIFCQTKPGQTSLVWQTIQEPLTRDVKLLRVLGVNQAWPVVA